MNAKTKSNLKKLALLAGGALAVNELAKPNSRAANVKTKGSEVNIDLLTEKVVEAIKEQPQVLEFLKGATGAAGGIGATGAAGASGDTILNFGGSLLKNGAFESGDMEGWIGTSGFEITSNKIDNLPIAQLKSGYPLIKINKSYNKRQPLLISFNYFGSATGALYILTYDPNIGVITNDAGSHYISREITPALSWQKRSFLINPDIWGNGTGKLTPDTFNIYIMFSGSTNSFFINSLVVKNKEEV